MSADTPTPIDPRGPRFNQSVLAAALVLGAVTDFREIAAVFAIVLGLGAAFGPKWGPVLRFYSVVIRPRLGPPEQMEDPRPPRFAATLGTVFLVAATLAFLVGYEGVGWALALMVAALAALAAFTGICVGCEMYVRIVRWQHRLRRGGTKVLPVIPESMRGGSQMTWVVFTSQYCSTCRPVVASLRAAVAREDDEDPFVIATKVVPCDVLEMPDLVEALDVRSVPTAILADSNGEVIVRLVGPAALSEYLRTESMERVA